MTDLGYRLASMLFRRLPSCASDRLLHAISDGYVFTHPRRARAVLVSGHFGPWERALQWLAGELGGVEALAAPHRLAAVDRFFVQQRERGGVRTLCSSRPVRSALRSLQSGGWIAALADRPRRSRFQARGIGPIDPGPLRLARRAQALVLPGV